jgi:hypothetical protein
MSSLAEENGVWGRKFGLGGDRCFLYRVVAKECRGSGDGCVVWRSEWGLVRRALELEGASDTGPGAMMRVHSESWGFGGG